TSLQPVRDDLADPELALPVPAKSDQRPGRPRGRQVISARWIFEHTLYPCRFGLTYPVKRPEQGVVWFPHRLHILTPCLATRLARRCGQPEARIAPRSSRSTGDGRRLPPTRVRPDDWWVSRRRPGCGDTARGRVRFPFRTPRPPRSHPGGTPAT